MSNTLGRTLATAVTACTLAAPWLPSAVISTARADETQAIEGCQWSDAIGQWVYPDGQLCRGTGEDPTTDFDGNPVCADVDSFPVPVQRYGITVVLCTQDPPPNIAIGPGAWEGGAYVGGYN